MSRFYRMLIVVGLLSGQFGYGRSDSSVSEKYLEAVKLFGLREDHLKNQQAIELLSSIEASAPSGSDLKYDINILLARATYFKGIHETNKDSRLRVFTEAMNAAAKGWEINSDYAEAYYYYAVSLGMWATTKGVMESLAQKSNLIEKLDATIVRETRIGSSGEMIDGYGPHRVYGRVYFMLPGFAGGSLQKSYQHLKLAYENAPTMAINSVFYADTLNSLGSIQEKTQACAILANLLSQDPTLLDPDRIPETKGEFIEGRKLQADICR